MMRKVMTVLAVLIGIGALGLVGCVAVRLPNVPLALTGAEASPPVLGPFHDDPPVADAQSWTDRRAPLVREAFQAEVYGRFPEAVPGVLIRSETLAPEAFSGLGRVDQLFVGLGEGARSHAFSLLLITPRAADGPVPVILMQNFCGNPPVFPDLEGVAEPIGGAPCGSGGNSLMRAFFESIFGSAILTPPVDAILSAGYGVALFYAGEVVPDDDQTAPAALARLPTTDQGAPTGAIAAWAWSFSRAVDVLSADPRIDAGQIVLWGHSRNGKAALLAAAFDPRPAAVIALQPGTGGGSLQRDGVGETIADITETYPHWFTPAYAAFAGNEQALPVDQHQLLALIAPRPVLLGAGRRDRWSDPQGAFEAARGASPVYALFGAPPFTQTDLQTPDFNHPLVTYMRGGLHGVHREDWEIALTFLSRALGASRQWAAPSGAGLDGQAALATPEPPQESPQ